MLEKIDNFDNVLEFLLLKTLFYTLKSLRISNWKIISHKIKQLHHLVKTMRIFALSQYLQKLVYYRSVLQVKFRFMGCLVKANALVLGNITSLSSQLILLVFTKQPSFTKQQIDIQQIFFRQYFCELLENSCSASKYVPKSLETSQKYPVGKSYVSKVAGSYRSNHRMRSVKKVFQTGVRKIHSKKACVRDSILIKLHSKGCKKETPAQAFSCEFKKFLQNTSRRLLLLLSFSEAATGGVP